MVGPVDRSNPTPTDDTLVAEAPTNTKQQPKVVTPTETNQPEAKPKSLDELRQAAVPVFQQLAASVGLKAPASAKSEDQVDLATKIWVKLSANVTKAQQSGDAEAIKAALDAKANFVGALVQAGEGRLNFGIPGVTSTGETPVSVKPPVASNGQSAVPPVDPAVQKDVAAVLGEVKAFKEELGKIKPEDIPKSAAAIEQRAGELLAKLKPLDQRLSEAENNGKAMSDAAAAVKVAIANLEGYIKQAQEMKNAPPTDSNTTVPPQTGNVNAPVGASPTPAEVAEFKKNGVPGIIKALDEGAAFFKTVQAPKNIDEAKSVMARISEILPKLTESAKQIAPFAKNDPATFGKLEAAVKDQIDGLTKMSAMLQKAIDKSK